MKHLRSATNKAYVVRGKVVPKVTDRTYLSITDDEFITLKKIPVVASLIDSGTIYVTDTKPVTQEEELEALRAKAAQTIDVDAIKEAAVAELREEAQKEISDRDAKINELERKLAELEAAMDEEQE